MFLPLFKGQCCEPGSWVFATDALRTIRKLQENFKPPTPAQENIRERESFINPIPSPKPGDPGNDDVDINGLGDEDEEEGDAGAGVPPDLRDDPVPVLPDIPENCREEEEPDDDDQSDEEEDNEDLMRSDGEDDEDEEDSDEENFDFDDEGFIDI
ncbi:hypothetical protein B0H14DRAFT_2582858 [Mycena olivaceomarginata]|nr:hypothetical protein B0H14DRAFT_2582858 [Mycena olivaceomarginata]